MIRTLQEALSKDTDPKRVGGRERVARVQGGRDRRQGQPVYIHVMLPAVPDFDYRPSLLLDELVKDLAPDLLTKYQDAFADAADEAQPDASSRNMSVAPVPQPPVEEKPGGQLRTLSRQKFRLPPT